MDFRLAVESPVVRNRCLERLNVWSWFYSLRFLYWGGKRGLRLSNRSCRSLSCLCLCSGYSGFDAFIKQACFFTQQILDIVAAAHARSSYLFIKQSVCHRGHAYCGCGPSVLTEEEGLGAALRTSLLSRSRQSKRVHASALTNEHFDVIAVGHACRRRLFLQQLTAKSGQVE